MDPLTDKSVSCYVVNTVVSFPACSKDITVLLWKQLHLCAKEI